MKIYQKNEVTELSSLALGLVVFAVVIGVGVSIVAQLMAVTTNATAIDAINDTLVATAGITSWLPIIITVVVGALVIGYIMLFRK